MNYLQRFSAALAAREARQHTPDGATPADGNYPADGDSLPTGPDWLGEVENIARQLPRRGGRGRKRQGTTRD